MTISYMDKFSSKQHRKARAICKRLKVEIEREPIREHSPVIGYGPSDLRFSLAKSVYIYSQDDGWATDVVFERGKERTISQTPDDALFNTQDEAIQRAKDVLHMARTLERQHGTARTVEHLVRPFDLCGYSIELPAPEGNGDDDEIAHETVENLITGAQDIFYDECKGDIARALEHPAMIYAISALSVIGCFRIPADPEGERERATAL